MDVLVGKEVDLDEGRETAALTAVAMFMEQENEEVDSKGMVKKEKIRRKGNCDLFERVD